MRVKVEVKIELTHEQLAEAQRMVNLHHLGDEEANKPKVSSNYFEAKYPEKETDEFRDAHWRLNAGTYVDIEVEIDVNGNITLAQ